MRILPTEAALPRSVPESLSSPPTKAASGPSDFAHILQRIGRELDRGEALVSASIHGTTSSDPAALIALQAGIYRYTELVDLTVKIVETTNSAVKTILQAQ